MLFFNEISFSHLVSAEAKKKTPEKKGVEFKDPKEPAVKKTKFTIKHSQISVGTIEKIFEKETDKEKEKEKKKVVEKHVSKPTKPAHVDAPTQTAQVTSAAGESVVAAHKEPTSAAGGASGVQVRSGAFAAGHVGAGSQSMMPHPLIGPKDTIGDIYYKTYTEEARGDAPHNPP
ncbi:hypothetical protein Hanom_Chr07g00608911 [Helianthus anomalus]